MTTLQDIPHWFRRTSAGQAIVREHETEQSAKRQQLTGELARLREERESAIPAENSNSEKVREKYDSALRKLKSAETELRQARATQSSNAFEFDRRVREIENALRESCDTAIDEFIDDMRALGDRERSVQIQNEETSKWDARQIQQRFEVTATNRHSLVARLTAIGDAIQRAEQLKLSPECHVSGQLDELRASLPQVVMESVA